MFQKSSLVLITGVVLSLSHWSSCQDWKTFQKKHITESLNIDCDNIMSKALFHCKKHNTFIYSSPEPVKAICKGAPDRKDVLSQQAFPVVDCTTTTEHCHYKYTKSSQLICVTCEDQLPVHFVGEGSCKNSNLSMIIQKSWKQIGFLFFQESQYKAKV